MAQNDNELLEDFPKKLRQLRQNRGWSQGQLGNKIDVDPQCISKYERGISAPPPKVMVRIATAFEVSLDYLMRGEEAGVIGRLKNLELSKRLEMLDELSENDQQMVVAILDAFIKKHKFEEIAHS